MTRRRAPHAEKGRARLVIAPRLELSLGEAQELVALIGAAAGAAVRVHWQADPTSPEVLVEGGLEALQRALERLPPTAFPAARGRPGRDPRVPGVLRRRVLVATPDEAIREVAVGYLQILGLDPDEAVDAQGAIERIRDREYDLLLLGNTDLGGLDHVALLRRLAPYLAMTTPVLLWTGTPGEDVLRATRGLGAPIRILEKPSDFRTFRAALGEALEWRSLFLLRRDVRAHVEREVRRRLRALRKRDTGGGPSPST